MRRGSASWLMGAAVALAIHAVPAAGTAQTVTDIASRGQCSTAGVEGLSRQLAEAQTCMRPGQFVQFAPHSNITLSHSRVHPFMQSSARDAVWAVADSGVALTINSAFRTLADQYVLYHSGGCGLAARPGNSNHQSGRAIDVQNYDSARGALEAQGCSWLGSSDPVHFDCPGVDRRQDSILAFQRLWNVNNPGDPLTEDGVYSSETASRLAQSPAGGFAMDGCDGTDTGGTDPRPECGNGEIEVGEACDDGNQLSGDGCDRGCGVERGWECSGSPSQCSMLDSGGSEPEPYCGDGYVDSGEDCDDRNARNDDGCDANCRIERGWECSGGPSHCTHWEHEDSAYPECGDGWVDPGEDCDDGNIRDDDGCDGYCGLEPGWDCRGEPSECTEDGSRDGDPGDGAESYAECGNARVEYGEECDNDRERRSGDGCDHDCLIESGWRCTGDPSRCEMVSDDGFCGDGWLEQGEACDDANSRDGDGCTAACRVEPGYRCMGGGPDSCRPGARGSASDPPVACRLGHRGSMGAGSPSLAAFLLLAWLGLRRRGGRRRRVAGSERTHPPPGTHCTG